MMGLPVSVPVLQVYVGDDFVQGLLFKVDGAPVDLSGWDGWRADMRVSRRVFPLSIDASRKDEGVIGLSLPHTVTAGCPVGWGRFDLQANKGDVVRTFVCGRVQVVDDVTKTVVIA